MNAPVRIKTAQWSADETQEAHRLLERLYERTDPDSDAASALWHAMEAVEAADCELPARLPNLPGKYLFSEGVRHNV